MALTTLIIDDSHFAVEALTKTIPWGELGLELIEPAYDGKEGMEKISRYHPDIILSDIQMPEMDGLTMMENMAEELGNSRVIFITAYEQIEYASRAIRLSAFDFILKPVDNAELCRSLKRAVESLSKDRDAEKSSGKLRSAVQRAGLLLALTQGMTEIDPLKPIPFLETMPEEYLIMTAEPKNGISGPMLQRLEYIRCPEDVQIVTTVVNGDIVIFCGFNKKDMPWQSISRRIAGDMMNNFMHLTIAVSDTHTDPAEFRTAYEETMQTLLSHHIYERTTELEFFCTPQMSGAKHTRLTDVEQLCGKMAHRIDSIDADQVWEVVRERSGGRIRLIRVMLMFFCTKVMQDKINVSRWSDSMDMTVYDLTKLNTADDAYKWLKKFFDEIKRINVPAATSLVHNVLEYVKTHVMDGLVLEDVAAKFYVSPNYLSSLIRKETGQTYRQFVIDAKMTMAKQLLNDTRMRVEDVAYTIGYENYISFYNTFKKTEHISPSEYRLNRHTDRL